MNQRTIIESGVVEQKIAELEAAIRPDDAGTIVPSMGRGVDDGWANTLVS